MLMKDLKGTFISISNLVKQKCFGNVYFTEKTPIINAWHVERFKESIILSMLNHNPGRKTVYIESSAGLCPARKSFLQAVEIYSQ